MICKWWYLPSLCIQRPVLYTIPWQNVGLDVPRDVSLSANQSEEPFQSEFSRYTMFLSTQWEIFCNWFHMMPVKPKSNIWCLKGLVLVLKQVHCIILKKTLLNFPYIYSVLNFPWNKMPDSDRTLSCSFKTFPVQKCRESLFPSLSRAAGCQGRFVAEFTTNTYRACVKGHPNYPQTLRILPRRDRGPRFWNSWIRHCVGFSGE